jgi:hypothetical protein
MAPRDFSEDGAIGAGSSGSAGSQTGGFSQSDSFGGVGISYNFDGLPTMDGSSSPPPDGGGAQAADNAASSGAPALMSGGLTTTASNGPTAPQTPRIGTAAFTNQFIQNPHGYQFAAAFEDGGAIDDTDGSPQQDHISKALETVDQVLAFGRKLHGLGGGDNEGAIDTAAAMPMIPGNQSETPGPYRPGGGGQKMAANMPSIPGSQSESGRPPQQPMPGPLPPTSNPFGKRADAGNDPDQDGDDDSGQPGAIDTDEDAA